jgi:phosphohistidine swiveling domain-containing protein
MLADRPADLERFELALRDALQAYPAREDNEFFTVSAPLALVRRAALEVGRRLTGRGLLDEPDHAFELTSAELRQGLLSTDAASLRDTVRRRLGERAWVLAHPGPASYGTPPPAPSLAGLPGPARHTMEAFLWSTERIFGTAAIEQGGVRTDGVLVGVPASAGRWTGTVRVVHGEDEFSRVRPGDVLVSVITSPVWSVVFPTIGALVTDTGGILSHPAIIAREYGVPAVVATREGTTRLRDGQVVLVDGTAGTVTPIDGMLS